MNIKQTIKEEISSLVKTIKLLEACGAEPFVIKILETNIQIREDHLRILKEVNNGSWKSS